MRGKIKNHLGWILFPEPEPSIFEMQGNKYVYGMEHFDLNIWTYYLYKLKIWPA